MRDLTIRVCKLSISTKYPRADDIPIEGSTMGLVMEIGDGLALKIITDVVSNDRILNRSCNC